MLKEGWSCRIMSVRMMIRGLEMVKRMSFGMGWGIPLHGVREVSCSSSSPSYFRFAIPFISSTPPHDESQWKNIHQAIGSQSSSSSSNQLCHFFYHSHSSTSTSSRLSICSQQSSDMRQELNHSKISSHFWCDWWCGLSLHRIKEPIQETHWCSSSTEHSGWKDQGSVDSKSIPEAFSTWRHRSTTPWRSHGD